MPVPWKMGKPSPTAFSRYLNQGFFYFGKQKTCVFMYCWWWAAPESHACRPNRDWGALLQLGGERVLLGPADLEDVILPKRDDLGTQQSGMLMTLSKVQ